jgi:hypothetical protein
VNDRIIQFPGAAKPPEAPAPKPGRGETPEERNQQATRAAGFLFDYVQTEALSAVIVIGIRPTPTGGDFFTEVIGDPTDLRNALGALPGVIERAYARKGITR